MVWQFASNGIAALGPGLRLTRALLTNQNPVGALGFAAGARRPGARQRAALNTLTTALTRGDELAVRRILGRGVAVNLGDDTAVSADGIGALLRGATWTKHIASRPLYRRRRPHRHRPGCADRRVRRRGAGRRAAVFHAQLTAVAPTSPTVVLTGVPS